MWPATCLISDQILVPHNNEYVSFSPHHLPFATQKAFRLQSVGLDILIQPMTQLCLRVSIARQEQINQPVPVNPNQCITISCPASLNIKHLHDQFPLPVVTCLHVSGLSRPPHSPHWRLSSCDSRTLERRTRASSRGRLENTWRRGGARSGQEMVERSGYTSLDILDGDCVRTPSMSVSRDSSGGRQGSVEKKGGGLKSVTKHPVTSRQGYLSLGSFFHNEDDSPLLVTSIDGISAQSHRVQGPSSLSASTFSLMTPADTPSFFVKSRTVSPSKESSLGASPATPYNSIRKRIKSVSIKYLKNRQRKKSDKLEKSTIEDPVTVSNYDYLSIDTKLKEISEKCSQLKSEAEQSISSSEPSSSSSRQLSPGEGHNAETGPDFSVSKTEAQIEYSPR